MEWTFGVGRKHPLASMVALSLLVHAITLSSLILLKIPSFDNSSVLLLSPAQRYLEPLIRWDTVYFLKIAQRGYVGENEMAFMPGLPLCMRWIGTGISWCRARETVGVEELIWAGVGSAGMASVGASIVLCKCVFSLNHGRCANRDERLSIALFNNKEYALAVALLYFIPPSPSTLNAVPYTEPFAAFFTFLGMLLYTKKRNVAAAIVWCIGSGFRAQGILLGFGFFGWRFVLRAWKDADGRLMSRCDLPVRSLTSERFKRELTTRLEIGRRNSHLRSVVDSLGISFLGIRVLGVRKVLQWSGGVVAKALVRSRNWIELRMDSVRVLVSPTSSTW